MQINIDKKVAPVLVGLGAIVVALTLSCFVHDPPTFSQVILGGLSIIFGVAGVIFLVISAITYFGWD